MYELEKQVGPLEKQSETARIYLKHRDTLKQYDANMYLLSFYQLKKDSAAIDEKMDIVSTQLKDAQENFEKIKSAYAQMEATDGAVTIRRFHKIRRSAISRL